MRVKTVPRQRMNQGNKYDVTDIVAETIDTVRYGSTSGEETTTAKEEDKSEVPNEKSVDNLNVDQLAGETASEWEKEETSDYGDEALDMSIRTKSETPEEHTPTHDSTAGPSSCIFADSHSEQDPLEDPISSDYNNNNIIVSNDESEPFYPTAGSSSMEDSKSCEDDLTNNDLDPSSTDAVNLCKKDCHDEDASNPGSGADDKLKDTFLYKIMTDPQFLESIQKGKQTKRYTCQFCRQEFATSDGLSDHMDVKKDESNQVVCCACKKTFAQKRYLRYHQRCHSERTKFTCDICTKKYTRMDNLSRHNAFHLNPDKFSCTYCEKTFARKDLFNKHLKCHDNKYHFFCETCQKYFKGPITLDNHRKNYHSVA